LAFVKARSPKPSALDSLPVSRSIFLKSANSAQASDVPSCSALRMSGESASASNGLPGTMPIFVKLSISAFSEGSVGQY
jgi:hypothetical protein